MFWHVNFGVCAREVLLGVCQRSVCVCMSEKCYSALCGGSEAQCREAGWALGMIILGNLICFALLFWHACMSRLQLMQSGREGREASSVLAWIVLTFHVFALG